MKAFIQSTGNKFFNRRLDFRVRLFNILAAAGIAVSIISAFAAAANGEGALNVTINLSSGVLAFILLCFASGSGHYRLCYIVTISLVFIVLFSVIFFLGGGYEGSMPYYLVFAILFTVFMLEGKRALLFALLELLCYIGLFIVSYYYPDMVIKLKSPEAVLRDNISGLTAVSLALSVTMYLHFKLYKKQQKELEAAREEAIKLSEAKNTFLASMSHEIRTPINVMLGMTEMILRESQDETVSAYAKRIKNAGDLLMMMVNNSLDLSKIESGRLEIIEKNYYTADLIRGLYEIGDERARSRGLEFLLQTDEALPSELFGDFPKLIQIVSNFLSNAASYTSTGYVKLSFSCMNTNKDEITLKIEVEDTGLGISAENLPFIFDAFARFENSSVHNYEGAGLGLAIARELAEHMRATISVESVVGSGSVFWVELPQRISDSRPIGVWNTPDISSRPELSLFAPEAHILIVDDNNENLQTLSALLKRTQMNVQIAYNGENALDALRKEAYDIILMDYMMPGMDGIETVRRIRSDIPDFNTPVIALTANVLSGTKERLLNEGFAACLVKPVSAAQLESTIAGLLPAGLCLMQREKDCTGSDIEEFTKSLALYGVKLDDALLHAGGDLELAVKMGEIFTRNYEASRKRMEAAFSSRCKNLDGLRHCVHSLRSGAGFVGAATLSAIAECCERGCETDDMELTEHSYYILRLEWERAYRGLLEFIDKHGGIQRESKKQDFGG